MMGTKNTEMGYQPDYLTTAYFAQRTYEHHKAKLGETKPFVQTHTEVLDLPHLKSRPKKRMMQAERNAMIAHDNMLLLKRLSHIMNTKQADDRQKAVYTSDIQKATREKYRQFRWQKIADENAKMSKRIAATKSEYSRSKMKKDRAKYRKTPAALSNMMVPWTLGATASRLPRRVVRDCDKKSLKRKNAARVKEKLVRLQPTTLASASRQSSRSTRSLPDNAMPLQQAAKRQLDALQRSIETGDNYVPFNSTAPSVGGAMAEWEEIKSWSIWDLPLKSRTPKDVNLSLTSPAALNTSAFGDSVVEDPAEATASATALRNLQTRHRNFNKSMSTGDIAYNKHDTIKSEFKTHGKKRNASSTGFLGDDIVLYRERRTMDDGAMWTLQVVEIGFKTGLQDDAMAGFRVEGQQKGGVMSQVELSVEETKELVEAYNDLVLLSSLKRCKKMKRGKGKLYTRLTGLRLTEISNKPSASQWEEESNRSKYLQKRLSQFLISCTSVDWNGPMPQLIINWGEENTAQPSTWTDGDEEPLFGEGAGTGVGAGAGAGAGADGDMPTMTLVANEDSSVHSDADAAQEGGDGAGEEADNKADDADAKHEEATKEDEEEKEEGAAGLRIGVGDDEDVESPLPSPGKSVQFADDRDDAE